VSPTEGLPPRPPLGGTPALALVENLLEAAWILDAEGRILGANEAACQRYGHAREAWSRLSLADLVAPEAQEGCMAEVKAIFTQGAGRWTGHHVRQDQTAFTADVWACRVETGQGPALLCLEKDSGNTRPLNRKWQVAIDPVPPAAKGAFHGPETAPYAREIELLERTCRHLVAALDQAAEAVAILDARQGTILHANAAFARTFGNPNHWAQNLRLMDLLQEDEESRSLGLALNRAGLGQAWAGRVNLRIHSGRRFACEGSLSPHKSTGERVDFLVVRLRDISLELEKDGQLRQAQRLGALGALAGGVAHDFNNLIGVILGAAELIELKVEASSSIGKKVEIIQQVCGRARELSAQILDFGRGKDGRWAPIDLTGLVAEVVTLLQNTVPGNVQVRCDLASEVQVLGDPSQLHQVLMNLGINGSQAMQPSGGLLSIRLQPEEAPPGQEEIQAPGRRVQLTVEDSGCGMDPRTLERIFEPFFTTKDPEHGTGLGLSVVQGIIKGHGGSLQVSSRPGQGSSFHIYLPLYQDRRRGPKRPDSEARIIA
jgi:PAS domain S-box-containing protein